MSTKLVPNTKFFRVKCDSCGELLYSDAYSTLFAEEPVLEDFGWHNGLCPKCVYNKEHKIYGGLFSLEGMSC
jgi:formylmethanofuran dehydrogenase subunit E